MQRNYVLNAGRVEFILKGKKRQRYIISGTEILKRSMSWAVTLR